MLNKQNLSLIWFLTALLGLNAIAFDKNENGKYDAKKLNELMENVWNKFELNFEDMRDYVFSESEVLDNQSPLDRFRQIPKSYHREYAWVVRDGYLVRSPILFDGMDVAAEEQRTAEQKWIESQKKQSKWKSSLDYFVDSFRTLQPGRMEKSAKDKNNPTWNDLWFFRFEPGKYIYAGEQQFEGSKVVLIDYKATSRDGYHATVRMSIKADEQQLVVFSMRGWINKDDIDQQNEYLIVMNKPTGNIWLPKTCYLFANSDLGAAQHILFSYTREFHSYKRSDVKANFYFEDVKTKIQYQTDKPVPPEP